MKILSPEEERAHYNAVLQRGLTWGAGGLAGGAAGALILNARWKPFQSLTLPLKAFAVTAVTTFTLIIGADRGSRQFEQANHERLHIGKEDETLEQQVGIGEKARDLSHLSTGGRIIKSLNDNKYSVVFGGWAASLIGSFAYISYSPLTTSQKLVQARMYAQGLTVAMLLASAGLVAAGRDEKAAAEDEWRKESATYRFKKNSPHAKEERERQQKHKEAMHEE